MSRPANTVEEPPHLADESASIFQHAFDAIQYSRRIFLAPMQSRVAKCRIKQLFLDQVHGHAKILDITQHQAPHPTFGRFCQHVLIAVYTDYETLGTDGVLDFDRQLTASATKVDNTVALAGVKAPEYRRREFFRVDKRRCFVVVTRSIIFPTSLDSGLHR